MSIDKYLVVRNIQGKKRTFVFNLATAEGNTTYVITSSSLKRHSRSEKNLHFSEYSFQ